MERETAYAKINLALHVRRRRADGYHDIETVFAFCEDGDEIQASNADRDSYFCSIDPVIPSREVEAFPTHDNLVVLAAEALRKLAGVQRAYKLHLDKRLPVAAGLGGGSADAAATLRLLARAWALHISDEKLLAVALSLGSDVPACLASVSARGEGRGEALMPVAPVTGASVLLVNPRIPLSTAQVFAAWDGVDRGPLGDWRDGRNDLEAPARALVPEIGTILDWLTTQPGITLGRMSGSGATCFALFDNEAQRDKAAAAVPAEWWRMASRLR